MTTPPSPDTRTDDDDRLYAALAEAAGLVPPPHLKQALFAGMRDLRKSALVLKTMPLDQVESASVFRVELP